jgi:hypothetical protein
MSESLLTTGFCSSCSSEHSLSQARAKVYARQLMANLEEHQRIDYNHEDANENLSTDYLFGDARGQMFGLLLAEDEVGNEQILHAFSGQYNACWEVDGWAPPLLDLKKYNEIVIPGDKQLKAFGYEMNQLDTFSEEYQLLKQNRKELSQMLMGQIHNLYRLINFRGETNSLKKVWSEDRGIPTGTADCCAPKLLNWAAQKKLKPLALAEFYFGKTNRSGTRKHGQFYSSCKEKCEPILGFILCGSEDL